MSTIPPVSSNGHDAVQGRRRPPGPSTRPALVVFGIALLLTVVGAIAAGLTGGPTAQPKKSGSVATAKGSPLRAEAATDALSPITSAGLPPTDILGAVDLPKGATFSPGSVLDSGVGLYDHTIGFTVAASQQDVIAFYRVQLRSDLWRLISQGEVAGTSQYRLVGQHPGSNGYEWEIGVTVMPQSFSGSTASTSSYGVTPFTIRLFENSYDD